MNTESDHDNCDCPDELGNWIDTEAPTVKVPVSEPCLPDFTKHGVDS